MRLSSSDTAVNSETGQFTPGTISAVPLSTGGYRGYFGDLTASTDPDVQFNIGSATTPSTGDAFADLLTWNVELDSENRFNRIGSGAGIFTSAQQPHALQRSGDCVTLFYNCPTTTEGICYATPRDGLHFLKDTEYELDLGRKRGRESVCYERAIKLQMVAMLHQR